MSQLPPDMTLYHYLKTKKQSVILQKYLQEAHKDLIKLKFFSIFIIKLRKFLFKQYNDKRYENMKWRAIYGCIFISHRNTPIDHIKKLNTISVWNQDFKECLGQVYFLLWFFILFFACTISTHALCSHQRATCT